jgi:hypothetical protein
VFTQGSKNLLRALHPHHRVKGEAHFPLKPTAGGWRYSPSHNDIQSWFKDCVDRLLAGQPERCAIEENIAVFAEVGWDYSTSLERASVQVVVVLDGTVEDFYLGLASDCQYLRMDLDPQLIGPIFKEGLPHIHSRPLEEPRFSGLAGGSGNVVADFVEFVYRNYKHDEWLFWARQEWDKHCGIAVGLRNKFVPIVDAFKTGKVSVIQTTYRAELERLVGVLEKAKASEYPLCADKAMLALLRYPR